MNNTKFMLTETLYLTTKVIDRSLMNDPELYKSVEFGLEKVKKDIRALLDEIEMISEAEESQIA